MAERTIKKDTKPSLVDYQSAPSIWDRLPYTNSMAYHQKQIQQQQQQHKQHHHHHLQQKFQQNQQEALSLTPTSYLSSPLIEEKISTFHLNINCIDHHNDRNDDDDDVADDDDDNKGFYEKIMKICWCCYCCNTQDLKISTILFLLNSKKISEICKNCWLKSQQLKQYQQQQHQQQIEQQEYSTIQRRSNNFQFFKSKNVMKSSNDNLKNYPLGYKNNYNSYKNNNNNNNNNIDNDNDNDNDSNRNLEKEIIKNISTKETSSSSTTTTSTTTTTTIQLIFQRLKIFLILLLMTIISSSKWLNSQNNKNQINFMIKNWNLKRNQFLGIFYVIICVLTRTCTAVRQDVPTNCTFPQKWEGSWFLSGYQQSIQIRGSQFSYRGKCTASDGNKYLIVDEKGCHRCLVIYEKHKNVLQYKESECEGDNMYMDQKLNPSTPLRSINNNEHNKGNGVAHPNMNKGGHSRLSSSDQYLMRSNDDSNDYFCKGRETLQTLCDQIPGDALLFSLFREQAEPVKCPLKGPFTFTYNRGHGECKSPVSNIDSCTEESRLLLSFQACPDVQGTESTVEELTCLATWKDGNSRYLVGLVSHHHAISNEERFRCFVYEKISMMAFPGSLSNYNLKDAEYKLAQSGDATCNGLDSAEVGSRIMTLRKPPIAERCDFPLWFKGPRHWHALMGNSGYQFHPSDGSMHITKPNGYMETRALCEQINKQTSTEMMAVVHYTTGCKSGFMCMMFYRRDNYVAEIQTGSPASRLEDACAPDHFDVSKLPYITLLASNPESQICALYGLYHLRGAIGPPYITSRHKRNHNTNYNTINKGHNSQHNNHHHHHHELQGHKRHETLNCKKSNEHNEHEIIKLNDNDDDDNIKMIKKNQLNNRKRRDLSAITTIPTLMFNDNQRELKLAASKSIIVLNHNKNNSIRTNNDENSIGDFVRNVNDADVDADSAAAAAAAIATNDPLTKITITQQSIQIINETQRNRRDAPGCIVNYKAQRQLWIGCTETNQIDVRPLCNDDGDEVYFCHGSWTENGTTYVIAKHSGTQHGVCLSYKQLEGKSASLIIGDACHRGYQKPPDHHLIANLTNFGKCGDSSLSIITTKNNNIFLLMACNLITFLFFIKYAQNFCNSNWR